MRTMATGAWVLWIAILIAFVVLIATGHGAWCGILSLPALLAIHSLNKRSMA